MTTVMSQKGQVVLPGAVRERMNLHAGDDGSRVGALHRADRSDRDHRFRAVKQPVEEAGIGVDRRRGSSHGVGRSASSNACTGRLPQPNSIKPFRPCRSA